LRRRRLGTPASNATVIDPKDKMHRCVGLMISGSMLFACDPRDIPVFAQS
jgi:hypothetical protein